MTNFTFNNSPIQEINEALRDGEQFTAVERILRGYASSADTNNTNIGTTVSDYEKATVEYSYDILLDRGNGRISRGFDSLLTLSRIISGKSGTSPMLQSNPILFSNSTAIKNANHLGLRIIVLNNLGLRELINPAGIQDSAFVINTLSVIDNIGRDVQRGQLVKGEYNKDMLARSKQLVRLSDKQVKGDFNG